MDSQPSAQPGRSNLHSPLRSRIQRMIRDASRNETPKASFIEVIWPALEEEYGAMVQELIKYCDRQLHDNGIPAKIEGRAKSLLSIEKSIERREKHRLEQHKNAYQNIREIFDDLHDLAGIRIVVDYPSDIDTVEQFIKHTFQPMGDPNIFSSDRKVGRSWKPWFGAYKSCNYRVKLKSKTVDALQSYCNVLFEVQITSLPESLYNRLAHPLLYKKPPGSITRKEEMVVDMSHGLALCYSICLLCMQDKLDDPSKILGQQALRDAMRKVVPAPGVEETDQDMEALVEMTPDLDVVFETSDSQNSAHEIESVGLKRRASFGKTLPVEALLGALQVLPEGCHSSDDLWVWMTNKLESAIQETNQPPIKLPTVEEARYNSEDVQGSAKCHEGTRTRVRSKIRSWADNPEAETIFWLYAPAGTGKSTLARSLVDDFSASGKLGAGYFFKRGDAVRNNTDKIFSTIASQLIETIPHFQGLLRHSLKESHGAINMKSLEEQFKILIRIPLSNILPFQPGAAIKIIIIDALDECDRPEHIPRLLKLFALLGNMDALRVRVLFTSRFAPPIVAAFGSIQQAGTKCHTLALHEEFYEETKSEIVAVLEKSFAYIKEKRGIKRDPWPAPKELDFVVSQALSPSPLFIYVATLLRFIDDERGLKNPVKRFQIWLNQCRGNVSQLDQMYLPILESLFDGDADHSDEKSELLDILGSVVFLAKPLPLGAFARVLNMDEDTVGHWVRNLHAVLHVPGNNESPVEIIHKSFGDFLISDSASDLKSFGVNALETHRSLATRCMHRLSEGLCKNICKLRDPTVPNKDIAYDTVNRSISIDLQYACMYWVHHLVRSKDGMDGEKVYQFLQKHFLHWVEAFSLLAQLPAGGAAIEQLLVWSQGPRHQVIKHLTDFLKDAERFVIKHSSMIGQSPLQVYGSALVFSPSGSIVRNLFFDTNLACIQSVQGLPTHWNPLLQTFYPERTTHWNFSSYLKSPCSVALTTDGRMIAMGYGDGSVELWSVRTDIHQQESMTEGSIIGLSFLKGDNRLAMVSSMDEVLIWDIETRNMSIQCILHRSGYDYVAVLDAALSPSHSLVATIANYRYYDSSLDIWDFQTGAHRTALRRGNGTINKGIAFSPDGKTVASIVAERFGKCQLDLWNTETGVCSQALALSPKSSAPAFSPNGTVLAYVASRDIVLCELTAGTHRHILETDNKLLARAIVFAPAGDRLIEATTTEVNVWDISNWIGQQTDEGAIPASPTVDEVASEILRLRGRAPPSGFPPLFWYGGWALSPDKKIVAMTAMTIDPFCFQLILWDIEVGTKQSIFHRSSLYRSAPAFAVPPDGQVIAFSPDGQVIAVGVNMLLKIFEVTTGNLVWHNEGLTAEIGEIVFSPEGNMLAATSDKSVWLFEVATGRLRQKVENLAIPFISVAFSPDGVMFAIASSHALQLYELGTKTKYSVLSCEPWLRCGGNLYMIETIAFSTDGNTLQITPAVADWVLFWDIKASQPRRVDADFGMELPTHTLSTLPSLDGAVQIRCLAYGLDKILCVPRKYSSWETVSSDNRLVMRSRDGELIILDFDLALLDDVLGKGGGGKS